MVLPVGLGHEVEPDASGSKDYEARLSADLSAFKLLIVDDIESNRKLLRELMEKSGIAIREAATARQAIAEIEAWHPSIVLMDIRMPLMSGDAAISELRRNPLFATLPIIAVSANAMASERERLMELGATDFISKPFMKEEIYRKMLEALNVPLITRQPIPAPPPVATGAPAPPPTSAPESAAPAGTEAAGSAAASAGGPAEAAGNARILVVDDNAANRQLLFSQLKALGFAADTANNGQQALEQWQQQSYDIIFADCTMPVLSGIEMARRIRTGESSPDYARPSVYIVAITGSPDEYREQCREAGMNEVLGKPLLLKTLKQTLARFLPG
jgi:CheY-like chemotaxis protein